MTLAGKLGLTGFVPLALMVALALIFPAPHWAGATAAILGAFMAAFWTAAALVFIWREM